MSFREPGSDSSTTDFWVPTQTYGWAAVSHPFLHCSPASSLVSLPLLCSSQSFVILLCVEGDFLQDVAKAVVTCWFPRSPALPSVWLLAHCSVQENSATRPLRVCANLGWLWWVSIVLHGNYVNDCVCMWLLWSSSAVNLRYECVHTSWTKGL